MSIKLVERLASGLPYSLSEQITGYARSVKDSLEDIFAESHIRFDETLADQIVLIAGVKKLYDVCSSNFWTLDNSLSMLSKQGTSSVRIGSNLLNRESEYYTELRTLMQELDKYLDTAGLRQYIDNPYYNDILKDLAHERG